MPEDRSLNDREKHLKKYAGDAMLADRAAQSLQSRIDSMRERGWPELEGSNAELDVAVDYLQGLRDAHLDRLADLILETEFAPWIEGTPGLGAGYVGWLTGQLLRSSYPFPTVSALWSYTGLNVVDGKAPQPGKGVSAGFDPDFRAKIIHRIAVPAGKRRPKNETGSYREVWDERRAHTEENRDWADAHKAADADRVVAKAILRDWWRIRNGQTARVAA